ncbi:MAG: Erythritol/L-threitol dehydrogenase [Alphaproteobacteria bacterium MarineAlpha3_Bin4]|nr:MAG: Erythritol/L-threitol dehydrogenase [Alphaproteobacteria bacterium MarineAlpha3_Bin4]
MPIKDNYNSASSHTVVTCKGGGSTCLECRPVPEPSAGEMLLRLRVVGFCGTDLFKLTTGTAAAGTVLGHEVVGEVIKLGDGVSKFHVGDRVAVPHHVPCGKCVLCQRGYETMCETFQENLMEPGGFADNILMRPRATELAARVVPKGVSDDAAVFMEPAACVLRGIRRSELTNKDAAIVLGAGSMGLLHLLVLRATLPRISVVVVDPVRKRRDQAAKLGAAKTAASEADALEAVSTLTDGFGADVVFDTVGGASVLGSALRLSRQGGSVVLFAHAKEGEQARFELNELFKYERRILGTYSGALTEQAEVFKLLKDGTLDPTPLITHKMPLNDFDKGVSLVKNHEALKVLFTPSLALFEER